MNAPDSPDEADAAEERQEVPLSQSHVDRAFEEALAVWDVRVMLSPPAPLSDVEEDHWGGREPLAYIDLKTRQVVVNLPMLAELDAAHALTAVLAHEVGHHVRFPHTLAKIADFAVMEKELLPSYPGSLLNLFFDLQVNEVVGRDPELRRGLADVYRASVARAERPTSALFGYYLAIYESLWGLDPGDLVGAERFAALELEHPGFGADATIFAATFWSLDDEHLAFAYAIARFSRYLGDPDEAPLPMSADLVRPDAADIAGALRSRARPHGAIDEARRRGWLGPDVAKYPPNAFGSLDRLSAGQPGDSGEFRQVIVESLYLTHVERHLIEIPPVEDAAPEPFLPSTTAPWEAGDSLHAIDWTASVLAHGPLAAAMPLRRELLPDGEPTGPGERVAIEIYVDTSGSMPNPQSGLNAMTLAALIVGTAATRALGRVRGVIYSSSHEVSPWMYSEDVARRFLLRYRGGGTRFPFARALELAKQEPGVLRLVVSDSDFLHNVSRNEGLETLLEVAERSRLVSLLLLLHPNALVDDALGKFLAHPRGRLVVVRSAQDLPAAAAALSRALFDPPKARGRGRR